MNWIFLLQWAGNLLWFLSLALTVFILIFGLKKALTFEPLPSHDKRWFAVGPIFTWFIALCTTFIFVWNGGALGAIVGRLANLAGIFDAIALLHATSCILLIIVTSVRAFFVISEMDSGRYAGGTEIPILVASSRFTRPIEAVIRLGILIALTLFAGAFMQIVMPSGSGDFRLIGTPVILSDITKTCIEYEQLSKALGHGFEWERCMSEARAHLPSYGAGQSLESLARAIVAPVGFSLIIAYILMFIWTLVVWHGCKNKVQDKSAFKLACNMQWLISFTALSSTSIMYWWINIAIHRRFLGVILTDETLKGLLLGMSVFGLLFSTVCFVVLVIRMLFYDTVLFLSLIKRLFPPRASQ